MNFIKHTYLFIKNHLRQMKRKWLSLPLLLLFPVFLIGSVIFIIFSFFNVSTDSTVLIGVVNEDQSKETEVIIDVLEDMSEFGTFMEVESMTSETAQFKIEANEISSYILLSKSFTENLYEGIPVTIPVIGNPQQKMESNIVHELVNSVMRHIKSSQANILLLNEYAKETSMDNETRSELLMNELMRTFLGIAGKDKIVKENMVDNYSTSSPINYFVVSSIFIIVTIWLLTIFHFLYRSESFRMKERMRLYGVTELQQIIARIVVALFVSSIFSIIAIMITFKVVDFDLYREDIGRLMVILLLYSILYLGLLAILEVIIKSPHIRLLAHSVVTLLLIGLSGALIPTIYFPLYIQDLLEYVPSYEALFWMQEVMLNDRLYADYIPLFIYCGVSMLLLIIFTMWKERIRR